MRQYSHMIEITFSYGTTNQYKRTICSALANIAQKHLKTCRYLNSLSTCPNTRILMLRIFTSNKRHSQHQHTESTSGAVTKIILFQWSRVQWPLHGDNARKSIEVHRFDIHYIDPLN